MDSSQYVTNLETIKYLVEELEDGYKWPPDNSGDNGH
jgi:hypothetical protein